ncbi:uncharacterized protein MELLADRAFT_114318 [Melampsora larici-populina 98AG31]|uniref:F-box domain-containing protein n=1 Tax=Melampsora larici-populina (strain 98AG31 / pathotype 3-4-7) TaxID=747676 RepID=F4SD09_MELLP|nr:uncharacterized protein MELLADRAFT_114318 [Melampsora larici-populina 98AG31]EGF97473.1 hypothetical protein MELLADRAFT_114318 [Melampsora larici-populina 98AG31]
MASGPNSLPIELVQLILNHFMRKMPFHPSNESNSADVFYLDFRSIKCLLNLRWLGRSWAVAILPLAYRSMWLYKSTNTRNLVMMWKNPTPMPSMFYLERLCLDNVQFLPDHIGSGSNPTIQSTYQTQADLNTPARSDYIIQMHVAADLIALCSSTLIDLKLSYVDAVGFSKQLVDAVTGVAKLKILILDGSNEQDTQNDCDSLCEVLNSMVKCSWPCFISDALPFEVYAEVFPQLRMIRALNFDPENCSLSWLLWRIFDFMEVFITDYHNGGYYWRKALKPPDVPWFQKPRHFKYIIFTTCHGSNQTDPKLVKLCTKYGLQCIFRNELSMSELFAIVSGCLLVAC